MKRIKPKIISPDDAFKMLEIYPRTKEVYDYIKEHPNISAQEIADAIGCQQVYTHVNRLEDNMLVSVQKQRERNNYPIKHYTAKEPIPSHTTNAEQQKGMKSESHKKTNDFEEYKRIFHECLFDDRDESITNPNFLFNIGGVDCFASNSLVSVAGKPGAGKSTTMAILAGVILSGQSFGVIECRRRVNRILWIDTEKDPFSCSQRMNILRSVANLDADKSLSEQGIDFMLTKSRSIEDRLKLLNGVCTENGKNHIWDVIFIDGLFELTENAGKLSEVTPAITLLQKLTQQASVFAMLHTNKQADDNNMQDVLGTKLHQKCTNKITISIKDGKHCIEHDKSNDTMLAPIVKFTIDNDGNVHPFIDEGKNKKGKVGDNCDMPENNNTKSIFESILKDGVVVKYKDLVEEVKKKANVKNDMAKKKISQGYNKGYLERDKKGNYWLKESANSVTV